MWALWSGLQWKHKVQKCVWGNSLNSKLMSNDSKESIWKDVSPFPFQLCICGACSANALWEILDSRRTPTAFHAIEQAAGETASPGVYFLKVLGKSKFTIKLNYHLHTTQTVFKLEKEKQITALAVPWGTQKLKLQLIVKGVLLVRLESDGSECSQESTCS